MMLCFLATCGQFVFFAFNKALYFRTTTVTAAHFILPREYERPCKGGKLIKTLINAAGNSMETKWSF